MQDLEALLSLNSDQMWPWVARLFLIIFCSWLVVLLIDYPFRYLWSRGYDATRKLVSLQKICKLFAVFVALVYLIKSFALLSSLYAPMILVAFLIIIAVSQLQAIRNLISGALILFQGRIQIGMDVAIDQWTGTIVSMDLFQIWLTSDSQEMIAIPNDKFIRSSYRIVEVGRRFEVKLTIQMVTGSNQEVSDLKMAILSSPYRKAKGPVKITRSDQDKLELQVSFGVWNEAMIQPARDQLQKLIAEIQSQKRHRK